MGFPFKISISFQILAKLRCEQTPDIGATKPSLRPQWSNVRIFSGGLNLFAWGHVFPHSASVAWFSQWVSASAQVLPPYSESLDKSSSSYFPRKWLLRRRGREGGRGRRCPPPARPCQKQVWLEFRNASFLLNFVRDQPCEQQSTGQADIWERVPSWAGYMEHELW